MLFQADPKSKQVAAIAPSSFTGLGIWERRDLQEWVVREPRLLDEPLLVITTEFDRFDGSKDRLDVLAVDERSNLVVVELKRDQAAGHADLQALRRVFPLARLTPAGVENPRRGDRREDVRSGKADEERGRDAAGGREAGGGRVARRGARPSWSANGRAAA